MLKDDVLYLTVSRFSYIMQPSTLFSDRLFSLALSFLFHFLGIWDLHSVEADSDTDVAHNIATKLYLH